MIKLFIFLGVLMGQVGAFEQATFGAGCFWGVEYIFEKIEGIKDAVSGYAGGNIENPTYQQVLTKVTGHAEVVQLTFDPKKISYEKILEIYFRMHDPTQTDGQGPDIGPQYRSVIMYHNNEQKIQAENFIKMLNSGKYFSAPIITKVEPLKVFYKAEEYHQNYYEQKGSKPYCHILRPSFKL